MDENKNEFNDSINQFFKEMGVTQDWTETISGAVKDRVDNDTKGSLSELMIEIAKDVKCADCDFDEITSQEKKFMFAGYILGTFISEKVNPSVLGMLLNLIQKIDPNKLNGLIGEKNGNDDPEDL